MIDAATLRHELGHAGVMLTRAAVTIERKAGIWTATSAGTDSYEFLLQATVGGAVADLLGRGHRLDRVPSCCAWALMLCSPHAALDAEDLRALRAEPHEIARAIETAAPIVEAFLARFPSAEFAMMARLTSAHGQLHFPSVAA